MYVNLPLSNSVYALYLHTVDGFAFSYSDLA